jgi:hypothetical protein
VESSTPSTLSRIEILENEMAGLQAGLKQLQEEFAAFRLQF